MSDLNQISEETSVINDESKTIPTLDHPSSTLENDSKPNHINELESNESLKTTEDEFHTENDSEYEDVEEDNDTSVLTSITNKSPFKTTTDEDDLYINVKPRYLSKKHQDDEQSEGYEDNDDNQNVPKITHDIKKSNKTKELLDDDNNTQSPAYIPRKGKFYEHDNRTLDENNPSRQELSRHENRFYKDSDTKWQHDLYFRDEQISKSRYPMAREDRGRFERRHDYDREQLHLNDYMSQSQNGRSDYHQQQYYNDYRRRIPHENYNKSHNDRINNFDFKDYNRPLSYNRNDYKRDTNIHKETQTAPRQQRRDHDPYQIDERTFHRRRNFTNNQFQQHDNPPNRNDQRRFDKQSNENNRSRDSNEYRNYGDKNQPQQNRGLRRYELYEDKGNLPPRLQTNNNYRNSTQKQQYQQSSTLNLSPNISSIERPKRYSNMRNNMTNPSQQQAPSSQIQHHQDQHSNNVEQNDWPQAPPPPTSYLPQQIITPQMFYQQQTSRYIQMNSQQFHENK